MKRANPKMSRILPLIGAGIVLATFVAKDVMTERLKDQTDSLSSAETFYLSRTYEIFIGDDLNYLKQEMDLTKARVENAANQDALTNATALIRAQASVDHLFTIMDYVNNLAELVGKLHGESGRVAEAKTLQADCMAAVERAKSFRADLPDRLAALRAKNTDSHALQQNLTAYLADSELIGKLAGPLEMRATTITKAIISDLRGKLQTGEHNYAIAADVSYVLFGAGWLIGLLGQVLGSEGEAPR